ncbi:MAG: hypothetical protein A2X94_03815 [Bdellovibrionales bacterium GWB1_55_8]|nr:MAG: hypothetical protein A2X94_03815 [Bdellovibrionales bacterium GWB1_55_8]
MGYASLFCLIVAAQFIPAAARADQNEKVQVDAIKEKYWNRGDESELGVVQNRLYTKAGKLEVGSFFGMLSSDPFLSVQSFGGSVGFHLSEYLGLRLLGWKSQVSPSNALITFQETRGATTNTNEPRAFYGAEAAGSILYGKLSFLGKKIIYYDLHLLGGAGVTQTESGNYITPLLGVGQQIYLSKSLSLVVDYRLMAYRENLLEKVIPTKLGQVVDERMNWTNTLTLGISMLFGGGGDES